MNTQNTVPASFAMDVERLLAEGRTESALELAADGLRSYPSYIGGYALLADCYVRVGHFEDASVILVEAEKRFANREVLSRRRRELDLAQNNVVEVAEDIEESDEPVDETETPSNAEVESTIDVKSAAKVETAVVTEAPVVEEDPSQRPMVTRRRRPSASAEKPQHESPLRIIELAPPNNDSRVIRSAAVRLIPGLEYTSLRFEGPRARGQRSISRLPQPPSFRTFNKPTRNPFVESARAKKDTPSKKVSLEELADKINRTRLNADELEKRPPAPDPIANRPKPSLVTETLAQIYMQQKSFDKAIEAFSVLAEQQPDRKSHFDKLISDCVRAKEDES